MEEVTVAGEGSRARLRAALERITPELDSLAPAEISRVNVDVPTAVGVVLGSLPRLRELRPQIAAHLPTFDLERFDRLEDYALALLYAHGAYLLATRPPKSLEELGTEAARHRDVLLWDAMSLAARGLFDQQRVSEIQLGAGYRDLSADLVALVNLYRRDWVVVEAKTGIALDDLELGEVLADRLITNLGLREHASVPRSAALSQREKVFALFSRAYRDARRAADYLRSEQGDAQTFVPPLYAGRPRREGAPEGGSVPPAEPPVASDSPTPGPPTPAVKVGLPGSEPFTE